MEKSNLQAAIDVGSNTLRMLIGHCSADSLQPELYQQQITRLAGNYLPGKGLAPESIERTLAAITDFANLLEEKQVDQVRVVGTAALRRAENSEYLVKLIKLKTRLQLEIVSGAEEARLSAAGVLTALVPCPEVALIFDIGGGSTEIVFCTDRQIQFSCSYPLGVVQLCEEMPDAEQRLQYLSNMVVKFSTDLLYAGISPDLLSSCQLVGTAGTVTTLAAMNLQMSHYDRSRINNQQLSKSWLGKTLKSLYGMTVSERERLPGLEPGRGDLIVPGLELILTLCRYFQKGAITVADSGLLEGILLDFCND